MKNTCRVLVVNDDAAQCYALARMLQLASFIVIQASTGRAAVSAALDQHPDVVLLDINLPDMNGLVVAQMLRADPKTRNLPIIFHSAVSSPYSHGYDRDQAGGFLTTPVEPEQLVNVIRGVLARAADMSGAKGTLPAA